MIGLFKKKENKEPMCTQSQARELGKKCPFCGCTSNFNIDMNGKMTGIMGGIITDESHGFLGLDICHRYRYECFTCGRKWQTPQFLSEEDKYITIQP